MSPFDLLARHAGDALVAFGSAGTKTADDLLRDAGRIARALPAPTPGSHVLLVSGGDRYAIAAALLGALARGHAVALPPNLRRDAIFAVMERPETVAVLHETDAGLPLRLADLLAEGDGGPALTAPFRAQAGVIATVFTSGSTGPMLASPKTGDALFGEAHLLAESFGIGPGDRIVGTIAPVHIYGLLFTLLLPLAAGAAFARETPHHAEAIAHCVRSHRATTLVTVPAQLRGLASLDAGALAGLVRVVSSTAPLTDAVAFDFDRRHGLPIAEVFGSTETGGIAWRLRDRAPAPAWRPFPGVRIGRSDEGRLTVESGHLSPDLPRPFVTGDLVRLEPDGLFAHLGRVDGIVKIGGRRVSLAEVEEALRLEPGVADAAVVAVPAEAERGHILLAAVAPAGCELAGLRAALLERFEPACLPRRMLAVDAIPREENGKLQRARVLALFGLAADGRRSPREVVFGPAARRDEDGLERVESAVELPLDYHGFDGHFEGFPVLAGALQLKELVSPLLARCFPELGPVIGLSRVKFAGRIVPEDRLVVAIERRPGRPGAFFEIRRGAEVCSSGTLLFAAEGAS